MNRASTPILLAALSLAALLLGGMGCGSKAPTHKPSEFVGTWNEITPTKNDVMLDLTPDGLGTTRFFAYPHEQAIQWSLVGEKLILTAMDGTQKQEYAYRFEGANKLIVVVEGKDRLLIKTNERQKKK